MVIDVKLIESGARHLADTSKEIAPKLDQADAKLGDGDTGTMLARLFNGVADADIKDMDELGAVFMAQTKAALTTTGSSLGTLIGTALMTFSKATQGRHELEWTEVSGILDQAVSAMSARGKSALGDKTILDSMNAIARGVEFANSQEEFILQAQMAAQAVLVEMKDKPCQIGRARMYQEQSIGTDDPGMLAVSLLLK